MCGFQEIWARIMQRMSLRPLQRPLQSPLQYTCSCCTEQFPGTGPVTIRESKMCNDCFKTGFQPQFEAHLKSETQAPRWGTEILDIEEVQSHLGHDFVQAYKVKMQEYAVPLEDRIYCAAADRECGRFLGSIEGLGASVVCNHCNARTCVTCSTVMFDSLHICATGESTEERALEGLIQGRDYQECDLNPRLLCTRGTLTNSSQVQSAR